MGEDVDEQLAAGFQPGVNSPHQFLVIAHVLEHFHRHHPVEAAISVKIVHVGGDDLDVAKAAFPAARLDEFPLRMGVGHRHDPRIGIELGHPQRQRTPAAAQFQDVLVEAQFGSLAAQRQHGGLGSFQVARPLPATSTNCI